MTNPALARCVDHVAQHTQPVRIHWCDGTEGERRELERLMIADGSLIPLDGARHPGSFLYRSDPSDVARTEHCTYICTESPDDAGPTNNWMAREDAGNRVWPLFKGCMQGRTMYVVPYLLGPPGSPLAQVGIELTDSPYVALSLGTMTRMGRIALSVLGDSPNFVRGLHSLGTLDPAKRFICHFPAEREIWSINSGYGGNALLSKKCHALRIASAQARNEGWMAEHMLIMGLTAPSGQTTWFLAAFPSACGKTNLAMLIPSLPGYTVETVGDDIAWLRIGADGRLWAINPEFGMFGVVPGTSMRTNPNAIRAISHGTIFTNVALAPDGTPWWQGGGTPPPDGLIAWDGTPWDPSQNRPAAHPNSRFTTPVRNCPSVGTAFHRPEGVPISGIIFGGRRAKLAPLVYEALDWQHGVYVGATMVSETTAAATGAVGVPRHDPMAMLPFCGYHMGNYFRHWLDIGSRLKEPPRVFHVNWFRTGDDGKELWPGFGENVRPLKWMVDRINGTGSADVSPIGLVPSADALDLSGLTLPARTIERLLDVDPDDWTREAERHAEFLRKLGDRVPPELWEEHSHLLRRLDLSRRPR